ncbi:flagellar biosynthetic protein FliO [Thaumasiovibrio sp. DFM-14]|uniref:flagellar biosynthetic protein FliO n=1 Tax=Thaumasiovibrio sp. DFM-14 TaxID=3384792 RepID=UPI0039A2EA09
MNTLLAMAFALLVLARPAYAAGPDLNIMTSITSLLLVVGLILLLAWLVKRMRLPQFSGQQQSMRVVKQMPLGQKERLVVVEVAGEQLLLGVTSQSVNLVKVLETPFPEEASPEFARQFSKLLKKNDN